MGLRFFSRIAVSILALAIFFSASAAEAVWRLDGLDGTALPRNFRVIPYMQASASGQPSWWEFKTLHEKLRTLANSGGKIYLVDLRQEPHGFANDYPVSWYVDKNRANFYRGNDEIESDEMDRLDAILGKKIEFVPLGNADKKSFAPVEFDVYYIAIERAAAAFGFEYVRFGATDMIFPAPEVVDDFIAFLNDIDENDWLHLHCHAGHGRTTTFLVLIEILLFPDESLEDICARQYQLGGSNLLAHSDGDDWYAQAHNDRAEKLRQFYRYAHEGFGHESWREFLQKES